MVKSCGGVGVWEEQEMRNILPLGFFSEKTLGGFW